MIPPKPKLAQKSNYVIVASDNHQLSTTTATQPINTKSHHKRDDNNPFTIMPSSSLPPPSTNFSDCNDSCCGFLNNPIDSSTTIDNGKMHSFGFTNVSNFILHDHREIEDHIKFADRILSQTFDSSSSPSSGGSRELDIVTKTVAAFEVFEKEENGHHVSLPPTQPVGSSKIEEMKSRLFKQNEKQNHTSGELGISINRQQVQKSSKELEKILGMRMKTMTMNPTSTSSNSHGREDKLAKRLSRSFDDIDDDNNFTAKSIHKKLNEEMKQKSDKIKEKFLIEKVPAQQHYKDFMVVFFLLF
jgi:hypothetical protein